MTPNQKALFLNQDESTNIDNEEAKPSYASTTPHFIFIGSAFSSTNSSNSKAYHIFIFANKIDASATLHDSLGFVTSNDEDTLIIRDHPAIPIAVTPTRFYTVMSIS